MYTFCTARRGAAPPPTRAARAVAAAAPRCAAPLIYGPMRRGGGEGA